MVENKRKVIQALNKKDIDAAVNTNWPFLAPFMQFVTSFGVIKLFNKITGAHLRKIIGVNMFILLYVLKIMVGIPTTRGSDKLLGDLGAMNLVGLSTQKVFNGLCNRGSANQYGKGFKKNTFCYECLHSSEKYREVFC